MLRNHLLMAWRNFNRHRGFSLINVLGLSVGMAACLLILQYVTVQGSFDRFHVNASRLYRVVLGKDVPGRWVTPFGIAPVLRREFPQVEAVSRLEGDEGVVAVGEKVFTEANVRWVEPAFLSMFSFPLRTGNPALALSRPHTAVISPAAARKYFGEADPVGKTFTFNGETSFEVTGVLEEVPAYSHLQFDFLLSFVSLDRKFQEENWASRGIPTYVLLADGADPRAVAQQLPRVVKKHTTESKEYGYFWLQPLSDIHLSAEVEDRGVAPRMIYFLLALALFILVIAWINYINLATARATERAREVGVRKAMGANRTQLIRQFLLESVLLNALGIVLAFTIVQISLPYFRGLTGLELSLTLWREPGFWLSLAGLLVAGTVLSGFYPALVLSSFNPVAVLKGAVGRSSWRRGIGLRQGMVVFQFATCTCLMVGTTAVYLQTEFMRNQRPGIDLEQILVLKAPPLTGDSAARANRWQTFRQTVGAMGAIRNVTGANGLPSRGFSNYNYTSVVGKPKPGEGTFQTYPTMRVDIDFFRTFSLPLLAGRVFSPGLASDRQAVVLSGEAARRLGFAHPKEAIGRQIELDKKYTIIGVTQNYHHDLSKEGFHPTLFLLNQTPGVYFALKMAGGDLPAAHLRRTIREVEAHWKQIYPGNPFEYFFLDESFEAQYRSDEQLGRTVALFAFLTISVACLGLFGLASFTTTQRTKEIGIRKALGAPLGSLLLLLSRDFLRLVILANLMAAPLAHLAVSAWLENYAFDFPVSPWLYLLPMGIVLLIALLTVSYKTLRAAGQNPVKALRYE